MVDWAGHKTSNFFGTKSWDGRIQKCDPSIADKAQEESGVSEINSLGCELSVVTMCMFSFDECFLPFLCISTELLYF